MIDKVTPRKLDTSTDARFREKNSMFFAQNVDTSDNYSTDGTATVGGGALGAGNVGVLKPKRGNRPEPQVENMFSTDSRKRVIGSVADNRNNVVYFFVFSTIASEQGVYVYDPNKFLAGASDPSVFPLYTSSHFNFPSNGFVKADVVYADRFPYGIIYFTDNVNEPRKIDVKRAYDGLSYEGGSIHETDFITACPKTPMHPITFEFANDTNRDVSNFEGAGGFQFAYQCIYKGGEESAISTYSDIAVPPSYVAQGAAETPNIQADKVCKLSIANVVDGVNVFSDEIEKLRILVRNGNSGAFFNVDEIDVDPLSSFPTVYNFYNDRVVTAIPSEDQQKQFDSLPRKAKAQAVVDNRLFYGNYVEGYDEPSVDATISAVYFDRNQEGSNVTLNVTPVVFAKDVSYGSSGVLSVNLESTPNRVAGYKIDTSEAPDVLLSGSSLQLSFSIIPDKNFHIYNTKSIEGNEDPDNESTYHATREWFGKTSANSLGNTSINKKGPALSASRMFGTTHIPGNLTIQDGDGSDELEVITGTSAGNPIIIPGGQLEFSATISINQNITSGGAAVLSEAIMAAFSGEESTSSQYSITSFENVSNYSFDLGLPNTGSIDVNGNDPRKDLIFAVRERSLEQFIVPPKGYFILNTGDVSFKLNPHDGPQNIDGEESNAFLSISIDSVNITSVRTCVPEIDTIRLGPQLNGPDGQSGQSEYIHLPVQKIKKWNVYSETYLVANEVSDALFSNDEENGIFYENEYPLFYTANQFDPAQTQAQFVVGQSDRKKLTNRVLKNINTLDFSDCTIIDGKSYFVYKNYGHNQGLFEVGGTLYAVDYFESSTPISSGSISFNNIFFSSVRSSKLIDSISNEGSIVDYAIPQQSDDGNIMNNSFLTPDLYTSSALLIEYGGTGVTFFDNNGNISGGLNISDSYNQATAIELNQYSAFIGDASGENTNRTFKSKSNHDFGIVYYDERGRSGTVNYLGNVYIKGFSDTERPGNQKGKSAVLITLDHDPPDWAHHYQIVYGGNSSIEDYIQYTAGGAYVADPLQEEGNIYVSLNYLQNKKASYSHGFGAVNPDGGDDLYVFKKGDRLRVIYYYTNESEDSRFYPNSAEFEIVDSVVLNNNPDENPLFIAGEEGTEDNTVPAAKTGQFLVLKDNPSSGFLSYQSVREGGSLVNSPSHAWNNRCLIEIYTPKKTTDAEDRVYYEIGSVYNIGTDDSGNLFHQTNSLLITNGDSWWRPIALNVPEYDENNSWFTNIIQSENSEGNFQSYYVESKTFNDTVTNADVNSNGKAKIVDKRSKEVRRDASITYSDLNNYSTSLVRFTSFNASKLPYKDLPNEHGGVTFLLNYDDSLFCIQEDKCSAIPINRDIISTASGDESLVTSQDIVGTQRFYSGRYGCDNHPESVVKVDNNIYFVNKSNQEVVRFNPSNGLYPISETGMKSFFRRELSGAEERVAGGYDPLSDEYVISITKNPTLSADGVLSYVQPDLDLIDEGEFVDDPGGVAPGEDTGDGGTGGDTGGGVVLDNFEGVDLNNDGEADIYVPTGFDSSVSGIDTDGDGIEDTYAFSTQSNFDIETYVEDEVQTGLDTLLDSGEYFTSEELQQSLATRTQEIINEFADSLQAIGIDIDTINLSEATNSLVEAIQQLQQAGGDAAADLQADIDTLINNIYNDLGGVFTDLLFNLFDPTLPDGQQALFDITSLSGPIRSFVENFIDGEGPSSILDLYLSQTGGILGSYAGQAQSIIQGVIQKLVNIINSDENQGVPDDAFISLAFDPNQVVSTQNLKQVLYNNLIRTEGNNKVIGSGDSKFILQGDEVNGYYFEYEGVTFDVTAPFYEEFKLDINDDGQIGASDLLALISSFGVVVDFSDSQDTITPQE